MEPVVAVGEARECAGDEEEGEVEAYERHRECSFAPRAFAPATKEPPEHDRRHRERGDYEVQLEIRGVVESPLRHLERVVAGSKVPVGAERLRR